MKNKLLNFISEFENSKNYLTIINFNTGKVYKKNISANDIKQDTKNLYDWFLKLPFNLLQLEVKTKNGYVNNKQNYRKISGQIIDLEQIRNTSLNIKKQDMFGLNGVSGLNGVNEQGLIHILNDVKKQFKEYKDDATNKINQLNEELNNKSNKLSEVKELLSETKQDLKFLDLKESRKPLISPEITKELIGTLPALLSGLKNSGLNAPRQQEKLTPEQATFIQVVKKMDKKQIDVLYSVYVGLSSSEHGEDFHKIIIESLTKLKII